MFDGSNVKLTSTFNFQNSTKLWDRINCFITLRASKDERQNKEDNPKEQGRSNDYRKQKLAEYVRGWINYYKLADMKDLITETDE